MARSCSFLPSKTFSGFFSSSYGEFNRYLILETHQNLTCGSSCPSSPGIVDSVPNRGIPLTHSPTYIWCFLTYKIWPGPSFIFSKYSPSWISPDSVFHIAQWLNRSIVKILTVCSLSLPAFLALYPVPFIYLFLCGSFAVSILQIMLPHSFIVSITIIFGSLPALGSIFPFSFIYFLLRFM